MLSSKSKGLFVDVSAYGLAAATTTSLRAPLTIEKLEEFSDGYDSLEFQNKVLAMLGGKRKHYLPVHAGVYPESRFFRRHTVESATKARDVKYFTDLMSSSYRIDPNRFVASVFNASDGSDFNPQGPIANQKELLISGASKSDMMVEQEQLVATSLYPMRLELGTLSSLGAMINYLRWKKINDPIMYLEITSESSNLFIINTSMVEVCRPIPYGLNSMFPLIQQELGLKDEDSAKRLFYSNTFDFTEMGPSLLRKILKELQASSGSYEVQTGATISHLFMSLLPRNLNWLQGVLSRSLGLGALTIDYRSWLEEHQVTAGPEVQLDYLDNRWFGLISMMLTL